MPWREGRGVNCEPGILGEGVGAVTVSGWEPEWVTGGFPIPQVPLKVRQGWWRCVGHEECAKDWWRCIWGHYRLLEVRGSWLALGSQNGWTG